MKELKFKHGGNIFSHAKKFNIPISEIIDSSASIIPFSAPSYLIEELLEEIKEERFKYYPDKNLLDLRDVISKFHDISTDCILPGNGASELITWAGFESRQNGVSCLPIPGFVDYERSLNCWNGEYFLNELPKEKLTNNSQEFPLKPNCDVLWITNPHNPTGQLWCKESLEKLIPQYKLVICDEAFLSITPNGEKESLIQLTKKYDNLIVIRSLTKLFGLAGLRLGYMISSSDKINKFNNLRDPWPLNSLAIKAGITLLNNQNKYNQWIRTIHNWIQVEKEWLSSEISRISELIVHKSSTNFFLIESEYSLSSNINYLENKGILIRECSSFKNLDEKWARISLRTHQENKKIAQEIHNSFL